MAQRTIAAGGGNWNSTATWVEGAIPTSSDHVVGNATSGQLTINVSATIQYLDLTNYSNTITFTGDLTIGLASGSTIFGVSMLFSGAGQIICNVAHSFTQNTTQRIPFVTFGAGAKTLLSNLYVLKLRSFNNDSPINGNKIFVRDELNAVSSSNRFSGTTEIVCDGNTSLVHPGPYFTLGSTQSLTFDALGSTFSIPSSLGLQIQPNQILNILNGFFNFTSGSARYINILASSSLNPAIVKISTTQLFDFISQRSVSFVDTANIGSLRMAPSGVTDYNISSNVPININDFLFYIDNAVARLNFQTGVTFSIANIQFFQSQITSNIGVTKILIKSQSAGNRALLNLTNGSKSLYFNTNFTDINAVGKTIRTLDSTISNCVNVQNISESNFYSGGGGAFTFVN